MLRCEAVLRLTKVTLHQSLTYLRYISLNDIVKVTFEISTMVHKCERVSYQLLNMIFRLRISVTDLNLNHIEIYIQTNIYSNIRASNFFQYSRKLLLTHWVLIRWNFRRSCSFMVHFTVIIDSGNGFTWTLPLKTSDSFSNKGSLISMNMLRCGIYSKKISVISLSIRRIPPNLCRKVTVEGKVRWMLYAMVSKVNCRGHETFMTIISLGRASVRWLNMKSAP